MRILIAFLFLAGCAAQQPAPAHHTWDTSPIWIGPQEQDCVSEHVEIDRDGEILTMTNAEAQRVACDMVPQMGAKFGVHP